MSADHPEHGDHEEQPEDENVLDEDIVEIVEDDGDEPMDGEDDDREYDGEIIIGGPPPGEEGEYMGEEEVHREDNSWGSSCELRASPAALPVRAARHGTAYFELS